MLHQECRHPLVSNGKQARLDELHPVLEANERLDGWVEETEQTNVRTIWGWLTFLHSPVLPSRLELQS